MRMKTRKAANAAARWIGKLLEVSLPMEALNGLRPR
jgi:hypothetical protein